MGTFQMCHHYRYFFFMMMHDESRVGGVDLAAVF